MSQNSYTTAETIMTLWPRVIETTQITPGEIEGYINLAEGEINGALATRYTVPIPVAQLPAEPIKTIATLFAGHALLRSKITQEDPNRSDWVDGLRTRGEALLEGLLDGTMGIVGTSGALIGATGRATVWSSTSTYIPTMNLLDAIKQQIDPDRAQDQEDELD